MSYNILKQSGDTNYDINEYICDTTEDLELLPPKAAMGSTAIVLQPVGVYIKNSEEQWVKI